MAVISLEIDELPRRLDEVSYWVRGTDRVLITRRGTPVFQLTPTDATGEVPPPADPTARRPLGAHPGALSIPKNFNDPAAWADVSGPGS